MAFFDKLNDFAKNVGDKTKEAMETSKLNTKIRTEKAAIDTAYKKIGVYFYEKHIAGIAQDEEAEEFFAAIDASNAAIIELEVEIARIKAEKEAASKAPAQEAFSGIACPKCGKHNAHGTKFCGGCGAIIEPELPKKATGFACHACGVQNPSGTKFCGGCGAKLEDLQAIEPEDAEEPTIKLCPACGSELIDDIKFCSNCGAKTE